jgi:catechol 2,3-dioxygenase-like lactoylglutathione lyase family enzyme
MILALNHVQISIPKGAEDQARRFYCGVLQLKEIEKPGELKGRGGFWLSCGEIQVHVGTEDGVNRLATKAHIAFEVSDLGLWEQKLQDNGIDVIDGIPLPGYDRFEFRDPFGNRMEMLKRL